MEVRVKIMMCTPINVNALLGEAIASGETQPYMPSSELKLANCPDCGNQMWAGPVARKLLANPDSNLPVKCVPCGGRWLAALQKEW